MKELLEIQRQLSKVVHFNSDGLHVTCEFTRYETGSLVVEFRVSDLSQDMTAPEYKGRLLFCEARFDLVAQGMIYRIGRSLTDALGTKDRDIFCAEVNSRLVEILGKRAPKIGRIKP